MHTYAYLSGDIILLVIWLILLLVRRDLWKEMLFMSVIIGFLGPFSELWYARDYWSPEYLLSFGLGGLEDILFGFFIGGISAVLYEVILKKRLVKRSRNSHTGLLLLIALILIGSLIIFTNILGINSIYISMFAFIVIAVIIWFIRSDLIINSIVTGALLLLLALFGYILALKFHPHIFHDWWMLNNLSRIFIFGIPIEELLWFFSWGLVGGPLYEFWQGYRLERIKKRV